ncbi:hypothetical protein KPH14_010123 [Odynerus spinipes]|uniref:Dynein regulatory complex subunit 2 n=1 Tax=Odynerus spinipes TaxID=1348599 RepID=A0AAD9RT69_9HYME|nr:hypothetical protein KPH14_010123 [Odynerus spinipes]
MPPKRGKKALKWAIPMTKEEKRQAALERERALKRERLLREIELGALNTRRYRKSWREMMMRAKMPLIKEDIETAWRTFDRVLDNKDNSIQVLMKSVDEAEEQIQRSKNSHCDMIDRLLNVYNMRTSAISTTYESKIGETLNEANFETTMFKHSSNESLSQLQCIIHVMQEQLDVLLGNTKSKTMSKIDAFVSDKTNVRRLAAARRERQLNDLSTDLRRTIAKYYRGTKNRQRIYDAAREKDEKERQIITQQYVRIAVLLEMISKFREKVATHKANVSKDVKEIMDEQYFFHTSYWIMKNRFISEQKEDRVQLTVTTIEFKLTKTYLERLAKKIIKKSILKKSLCTSGKEVRRL